MGILLGDRQWSGHSTPKGWRSWNQFQCGINQSLIEDIYRIIASSDGRKSLLSLGYLTAGIDDCWQKCDSGPGGKGFHNASGYPIVDTSVFPDMKAMTAKARSLKVVPGWYGNNCHCRDTRCKGDECFVGDVQATIDFGFASIKLDGCGVEKNITKFAELFNATVHHVMLEDCHNGHPTYPTKDNCPMNFFRSSTDIRPTFGSVLSNLETTIAYNGKNLTGPGCWAYPDMLEVGVTNSQRAGLRTLTFTEARTHFGAWCIVSSPLILGMDLRDTTKLNEVWPIISNTEAIAVNQAWAGDAGVRVAQASDKVHFQNCNWGSAGCDHWAWMVWKKQLLGEKVAVLLMNNRNVSGKVEAQMSDLGIDCQSGGCSVRDVWQHTDNGTITTATISATIPSRDSAFIIIKQLHA